MINGYSGAGRRGPSLAQRARRERYPRMTDADLGAVAYDHGLDVSTGERIAAAAELARRNRARREAFATIDDETLAEITLNRGHPDQRLAAETLARRVLARAAEAPSEDPFPDADPIAPR